MILRGRTLVIVSYVYPNLISTTKRGANCHTKMAIQGLEVLTTINFYPSPIFVRKG